MAAVTSSVVSAAVAVKGHMDAKDAQKDAAKQQERAAIQSAKQLAEATAAGEKDVLAAQQEAAQRSAMGATEAQQRLQQYVDPGREAFTQGQDLILSGQSIGGPLGESLRNAALGGVNPNIYETAGIQPEIARQADIAVSGLTPQFRDNLMAAGQQGIAAAGDIGGIRSRGLDRLADIAGATGAQRASLLIGTGPQLQNLAASQQEAKLLSGLAGQQAKTANINTLSKLAGSLV
jgi:hypothetical protein